MKNDALHMAMIPPFLHTFCNFPSDSLAEPQGIENYGN